MKSKFIISAIVLIVVLICGGYFVISSQANEQTTLQMETAKVKTISSTISASGSITTENQVTLHFQTGGLLSYLPFKEGEAVTHGQTIASLDTYQIQKQLQTALNTYRLTRDTFDQTKQNAQDNQLQSTQQPLLSNAAMDKSNAINDAVTRIVDQNQANLDNSVIQVQLANYAQELASITTPITGIITHEDVTTPGVNVTTLTGFTIQDPSSTVFRAQVLESDIPYIAIGEDATVTLNGTNAQFQGTITKIYPSKVTFINGTQGYNVDISSSSIIKAQLDQGGNVLIKSNRSENTIMVPRYTVLNNKVLWVEENNQPVLKQVTVGRTIGNSIEILHGLNQQDQVILNPQDIIRKDYQSL